MYGYMHGPHPPRIRPSNQTYLLIGFIDYLAEEKVFIRCVFGAQVSSKDKKEEKEKVVWGGR